MTRPLEVPDVSTLRDALRDEIRHSAHARFLHRLHCMVLVGEGHNCYAVANCFGESPRALERWVHRCEKFGVDGLREQPKAIPGSTKLTQAQLHSLEQNLRDSPGELGYESCEWTGGLLRTHLERAHNVTLSVRHCQRLLRRLMA